MLHNTTTLWKNTQSIRVDSLKREQTNKYDSFCCREKRVRNALPAETERVLKGSFLQNVRPMYSSSNVKTLYEIEVKSRDGII